MTGAAHDIYIVSSVSGFEFTICARCHHWVRSHSDGCVCCERDHLVAAHA